jgi:hypothetical protein
MGGKALIDDALALSAKALEGSAGREAADAIPSLFREGYRTEAAPTADLHTKGLVDYLNSSRSHLDMTEPERLQRAQDMGYTYDAYHGAPRDIEGFDNRISNSGGYWGGHHYATTSPHDASTNYADQFGPDLMQRLDEAKQNALDAFHPDDIRNWHEEKYGKTPVDPMDPKLVNEWSSDAAHDALGITNKGAVYPVKMKMQNPVRIDSPNQTFWEHKINFDENGDIVEEGGPAHDLMQHLDSTLRDYGLGDREVDDIMGNIGMHVVDNGGIDPVTLREAVQKYDGYMMDPDTGETPSAGHVLSDVFQRMGHDGIIMDTNVFAPGRGRTGMPHVGGDTQHYIVFDPKNIRSRFGAFDPFKANSKRLSDAEGGRVSRAEGGILKRALEMAVEAATTGGARRTPNEVFPDLASRYPEIAPPVPAIDKKSGKEYLAKSLSPEAQSVRLARDTIQKDIDAGNYAPYFDVSKRADVDPAHYPAGGNTIDNLPKKQETRAKYRAMAFNPDGLQRLREGYEAGLKQKDVAENWYFMKQLEDEFVKELGPEEGRKQFKDRFGKSMALTTGGADPTSNLLMAYYGNYLKNKGLDVPGEAFNMPYPIGGRYASSNMGMFERNMGMFERNMGMFERNMGMFERNMSKELTPENPKRFNFQNNFLGHKQPTIDEQMSKGFDPKLQMPEWYGPYEEALNTLASEYKVDPRYFQEVTWAGLKSQGKGGYQGAPMIQHVNEAIERTSRLTGVPPEEVVKRALVRADMPLYAGAGAAVGAGALSAESDDRGAHASGGRIAYGEGGGALRKAVLELLGPSEREGLLPLTRPGSGYLSVPGKPAKVNIPHVGEVEAKPIPGIMETAHKYMAQRGLPGRHEMDSFPELDIEHARRVAKAFERMKHDPENPDVRRAYEALADETMDQFKAAKDAGIDFTAIRGADPYAKSPAIGYADIASRGHLSFFPTDAGFGSSIDFDPAQNPLLKRVGKVGDLDNATVNDAFRIVHDLYGHYGPGNPFFRGPGEERAYLLHRKMFSDDALPAMTTETRGQNSWLNYGPHGEKNRNALSDQTTFADQKTGIMAPWTWKDRADGGVVENAVRIARDTGGPVFMTDANGTQYDAQGKVITPVTSSADSSSAAVDTPQPQPKYDQDVAPLNYKSEVQPAIDKVMTPMEMPGDEDPRNPNLTKYEPDLVNAMKLATKIAARGQPQDDRGPQNWGRGRDEAVRKFMGAPADGSPSPINGPFSYNPSDMADYANTLIDFSPYALGEMAHDIPYQAGVTGDYGTAAVEGGLNLAMTAPGMAAIAAAARPIYRAVKQFPKVAAAVAGLGGATLGSNEAEAAMALPMEKMGGEQRPPEASNTSVQGLSKIVAPNELDDVIGKEIADKVREGSKSYAEKMNERYSVKAVPYHNDDGEAGDVAYQVMFTPTNGRPMTVGGSHPMEFNTQEDAQQWINDELENTTSYEPFRLSGLDLETGGEGMKGYYDNVYLKRVQKVLEKAVGQKVPVEEITVQTANGPRKQLGIRLTDEMREKARFSDFARGGAVTPAPNRDTSPTVSRALSLTSGF